MWNWLRKAFTNTAPILISAAVAVARTKFEESISHTDKLDPVQKELVRGVFEQFIKDLLAEAQK